ncbi:MAG: sensor histidine kinase [Acidimicrobiales bacterium]
MRRVGLLRLAVAASVLAAMVGSGRLNAAIAPDDAAMPLRIVPTLGIATGLLVAWPRRRREVLAAIALLPVASALVAGTGEPVVVVGATVALVAQTTLLDAVLRGLLGNPVALRRPSHAVILLGACLVAVVVGATVASASQLLVSASPSDVGGVAWSTWVPRCFVELALGVPALVALRTPSRRLVHRAGQVEAVGAGVALALTLWLALVEGFTVVYVTAPIIVWLTIRFGPTLAAPALAVTISWLGVMAVDDPMSFQAATSPTRFAALTMAFAAAGIALIYLAQEAADARFSLLTTLSALPDTVALTAPGGGLVEVWGPRDDPLPRRVLERLVADAEAAGTAGSVRHEHGRKVLEHTWQTGGNEQRLHVIREVTAEVALEDERRRRRDEVQLATLAEQRRIAVQLHGGPVQQLSAILLRHGHLLDADDPARELADVEVQLAGVIADLRDAANALIPPDVGAGSVGEALRELVPRVFESHVVCEVDDQRWSHHSTLESETLFLVASEALVNASIHAQPGNVRVALVGLPGRAVLSVSDDGPGMRPPSRGRRHLGLRLMRDRLADLGGTLELSTSESGGVLLVASIPRLERPSADLVVDLDHGLVFEGGQRPAFVLDRQVDDRAGPDA